jgi:hypothetical protein
MYLTGKALQIPFRFYENQNLHTKDCLLPGWYLAMGHTNEKPYPFPLKIKI